jgi:hypothetical protein
MSPHPIPPEVYTPADPAEVFRTRIEARAMLYAAGDIELGEVIPDDLADDNVGMPHSFARLCRKADAKAEAVSNNFRVSDSHVPASTLDAARYLIKQNDSDRFQRWLNEHSASERAAIVAHISKPNKTEAQHESLARDASDA